MFSVNVLLIDEAKTRISGFHTRYCSETHHHLVTGDALESKGQRSTEQCSVLQTDAAQGQGAVQGCWGSACHASCTSAVKVQVHVQGSTGSLALAPEHICVLSALVRKEASLESSRVSS